MNIYRSSAGLIVIDTGKSVRKLNHNEGTQIRFEQVGNYVYIYYGEQKVAGPVLFSTIFIADGVTPAGATVAAVMAYLETQVITNES